MAPQGSAPSRPGPAPASLSPEALVAAVAADPALLDDPATRRRHERLRDNASVCSFCGVDCPFTVEPDARGRRRVQPLSSLGLCVKGRTSLQTGGDTERATALTASRFDELALCDVAVLHGTNAYVTFPQAYEKLVRNTAAIKVVIDPTRSDTVSELEAIDPRTLHIRFRQGGDVLFNLAVARLILDEGWEDRESLEVRVDIASLTAQRSLCAEARCAPEEAARRIALPDQDPTTLAATIRRYARLIAEPHEGERPRVAFVSSMGINQSTGSYGFSSNLNLLLLTGNVGRRAALARELDRPANAPEPSATGACRQVVTSNADGVAAVPVRHIPIVALS